VLPPTRWRLRRGNEIFKSERDYTSSLHDFFKQTVDVLVTNVNVAHLPSTSPQRERLLELLSERGIETGWAHLSTYNLAEAKKNLEHYQRHFYELFSHMLDESRLVALGQQEREILTRLWPLWYFFAQEPGQRWASPLGQIPAQVRLTRQRLNQRFQDAIRQTIHPGVQIELLENVGRWEEAPAYWLHLDVEHPEELYLQFEVLVLTLRVAIGTISYQELMSYVLQEVCEYTVIVPTIRGRALNRSAWRLHTRTTVLSEPEDDQRQNQWKYIQQPIPDENWQRLNILVWDTPEIERANRLSTVIAETLIRVAQLAELSAVPGITEAGDMLMLKHVKAQSDLVSQSLQVVFDIISAMAEQLGGLSEEELQQRYYLQKAVQGLQKLPALALPTEASDGIYSFPLNDLPDYVRKLEQAVTIAESVRLYWIADTLNNLSDSEI
jgi:hypothetical protein